MTQTPSQTPAGTYDAILMNNVSHYLSPIEQLDLFAKIYAHIVTFAKIIMMN